MEKSFTILTLSFVMILIILSVVFLAYLNLGYEHNKLEMEQQVLKNQYNELKNNAHQLETELNKTIGTLVSNTTFLMPEGLDEHYERIRKLEAPKFTKKGDPGWLLLYGTQVLHDLGFYRYNLLYEEYDDTVGITCNQSTTDFTKEALEYINTSASIVDVLNPNVDNIELIFNWVKHFISYVNDTKEGHPRFPVETLVYRYGDCEDQAMVLALLLETSGYETALGLINDPNLTKFGTEGLYHTFCLVKKTSFDYDGLLITLNEYPLEENSWIILDPAYNQDFGDNPIWLNDYIDKDGGVTIPQEVWTSLLIEYSAIANRTQEIGIELSD